MAIDQAGLMFRFFAANRRTHFPAGPLSDSSAYLGLLRDWPDVMPPQIAVGVTFTYLFFLKDLHARFLREHRAQIAL